MSNSDTFRALTRHETYYLTGGDLFFLAEHVHFRVHRYFFERESPFFQRQLQVPVSPGAVARGSTEGTAIMVEERPGDFAKFLWVFYNPRYSLYNTNVDDWKIILHLAHKWEFGEVKNLVVRELEKLEMSDVDRIATYQKHDVDRNHLIPRYAALCEREQPLTLAEGMQLGMETTLMIARAREYARSNPSADGSRSPTSAGIRDDEMHTLVRLLFDIKPPAPVNNDDKANGSASSTGSGTPAGGLVPPPPPPKEQADKPTGKPTVTPTRKPTPWPMAPPGKPETEQQTKGKRGKTQPAPLPPLATTTTTPADPKPPLVQSPEGNPPEERKTAPEPLIDLGDPTSTNLETKDAVNGSADETQGTNGVADETQKTKGVKGVAGDAQSVEPVQTGEAGKTEESSNTQESTKPTETGQTGDVDATKTGGD